jgi:septum formation topological specificity factor MinE
MFSAKASGETDSFDRVMKLLQSRRNGKLTSADIDQHRKDICEIVERYDRIRQKFPQVEMSAEMCELAELAGASKTTVKFRLLNKVAGVL